jgi:hypothetical protein
MKTLTLFAILQLLSYAAFPRLYNGLFEVHYQYKALVGTATYNYDIVDSREVKNGPFKFVLNQSGGIVTITGNYKNNKKQGVWTHTCRGTKLNFLYSVNFTNGKRNGKVISKMGQNKIEIFSNATFKNDTLVGLFTINAAGYNSKIQLDKSGRILSYEKRKAQELDIWKIYRSTVFEGRHRNKYDDLYNQLGLEKSKNIVDAALYAYNNVGDPKANGYTLYEYLWPFDNIEIFILFSPMGFYEDIRDDFSQLDNDIFEFKDNSGDRVEYYPRTSGMNYFVLKN